MECTPQRRAQTIEQQRPEWTVADQTVRFKSECAGRNTRSTRRQADSWRYCRLSLGGCYIETVFPFPIGTDLAVQLSIETTVLIAATVVTCYPQVGNGIKFIRMLPEDREALKAFLEAAQQAEDSGSQG